MLNKFKLVYVINNVKICVFCRKTGGSGPLKEERERDNSSFWTKCVYFGLIVPQIGCDQGGRGVNPPPQKKKSILCFLNMSNNNVMNVVVVYHLNYRMKWPWSNFSSKENL